MITTIAFLLCITAAILWYGTCLFWVSLVTGIAVVWIGLGKAYLLTKPEAERIKKEATQMDRDGATSDKIKEYLAHAHKGDLKLECSIVPSWIYTTFLLLVLASILLVVFGMLNRV